jgi:hypothetical protein
MTRMTRQSQRRTPHGHLDLSLLDGGRCSRRIIESSLPVDDVENDVYLTEHLADQTSPSDPHAPSLTHLSTQNRLLVLHLDCRYFTYNKRYTVNHGFAGSRDHLSSCWTGRPLEHHTTFKLLHNCRMALNYLQWLRPLHLNIIGQRQIAVEHDGSTVFSKFQATIIINRTVLERGIDSSTLRNTKLSA